MGNQVLCTETKLRCTESCTRISLGERREPTLEDGQHCDPAGAVFVETLDELNDVDRQLILFSSSTNLVAVRWLLALGANRHACDSNGTTALHAACRSGTPPIVDTFLQDEVELGKVTAITAVDIAGWTPLHTAAFMGRYEIVSRLLKAGAPPDRRTLAGQTPADLCPDPRTRDVLLAAMPTESRGLTLAVSQGDQNLTDSMGALIVERVALGGQGLTSQGEVRFEPFFVPRLPVLREQQDRQPGLRRHLGILGKAIFERQPGRGLAFLVATGCVRDYPIDLVGFLRANDVDLGQLGVFLGEDFSLSKILRMEFINAVGLLHSGVVSALRKTFSSFRAPQDLQKVDRIVGSLAEVWWRQHQRLSATGPFEELASEEEAVRRAAEAFNRLSLDVANAGPGTPSGRELEGLELKRVVPSAAALHQLLFSAILLHWNLHAPLPRSQRVTLAQWLELNKGLGGGRADLPERVLAPIYRALSGPSIPHLWLGGSQHTSAAQNNSDADEDAEESAVSRCARVEGWARVVGDGLPALLGGRGAGGPPLAECLHMSSMLTEATASSRRRHVERVQAAKGRQMEIATEPVMSSNVGRVRKERNALNQDGAPVGGDGLWLSLCGSLLFLSTAPGCGLSPFAFLHLANAQVVGIEPSKAIFSIQGRPSGGEADAPNQPLGLVLLLRDGRWQSFNLPRLVVEVCEPAQLESWILYLTDLCNTTPVMEPLRI